MALYQTYAALLWLGLAAAMVISLAWLIAVEIRLHRLFGRRARGAYRPAQVDDLRRMVERLEGTLDRSLRSCGMVRFNPFPDTGGDQSFAIALVDAQGNGVVISSLYSRTKSRIYAKPLQNWDSPYALTDEEKEAIARARGRDKKG